MAMRASAWTSAIVSSVGPTGAAAEMTPVIARTSNAVPTNSETYAGAPFVGTTGSDEAGMASMRRMFARSPAGVVRPQRARTRRQNQRRGDADDAAGDGGRPHAGERRHGPGLDAAERV